jgi:heparanase 1
MVAEPPAGTTLVSIALEESIAEVSPQYLSFAVDSSQVLGGNFWGEGGSSGGLGNEMVDPYDFDRPRLRTLAAALAPAYLRVGGSEADVVYYDLSDDPVEEAPEPYELLLTAERWAQVVEFSNAMGFELFFTLNAGPGPRDENDAWQADNARTLVQHAADRNDPVAVWELGNEINGYPLFHALLLTGDAYAADIAAARALIDEADPTAMLAGPSSAYWPVRGEQNPIMPDFMPAGGSDLDIVSWHYYPTQSERCPLPSRVSELTTLLDPDNLDEVITWAEQVETLTADHAPQAEVWLGESGNAQCGGQPGVSDRFVGSLWWVDQLGLLARRGHRVSVRQTLSGSDYGLIDEETLDPRPDYWASVLWKRLMGTRVLRSSHDGPATLRTYAHCGLTAGITLVALNLDQAEPVELSIEADAAEIYLVEAEALDASEIILNGNGLPNDDSEALAALTPAEAQVESGHAVVSIPATAFAFVHVPNADATACQ